MVPSANRSGEEPCTTFQEVYNTFGNEIEAVIEGRSISNIPSTIVLVEEKYTHVFREGAIKMEDIKKVITRGEVK